VHSRFVEAAAYPARGARLRRIWFTTIQHMTTGPTGGPVVKPLVYTHECGTELIIVPAEWHDVTTTDVRREGMALKHRGCSADEAEVYSVKASSIRNGSMRLFHSLGHAHLRAGSNAVQLGKRRVAPWGLEGVLGRVDDGPAGGPRCMVDADGAALIS
jgi:hypothetical protein